MYHLSSQYRNWRYSQDELAQIRTTLNRHAVDRVRKLWEEEQAQRHQQEPPPSISTPTELTASAPPSPPPPSEIQYLTVADEQALVTYYLTQVAAMCGAFKYPEIVTATAMTYLKRFYLRNTCMDYHPKNIMLTCVFLATKTENCSTSVDQFAARIPNSQPADILALEFLVSQSLHFEYKVHHAHVALNGLVLDMQTSGVDPSALSVAFPRAQSYCRASRLTSAELVYTPAQIALACFRLADSTLVDQWLEAKEGKNKRGQFTSRAPRKRWADGGNGGDAPRPPPPTKPDGTGGGDEAAVPTEEEEELEQNELGPVLDQVQSMIEDGQKNPVEKARVKEVDLRLRWARNPEKDPNSALFKKRKAAEEALREEKDRAKAAKRSVGGGGGDDSSVFD